ncbi:hypothetical protein [Priestia megaterium]|uniref:hypothetical protein n=1 Tax=Priestia megaterium TaxID=1404 RepID=UPI003EE8522C
MQYLTHLHFNLKQHLLKELNRQVKIVTSIGEYTGILAGVEIHYITLVKNTGGVISVMLIPVNQIISFMND